MATLAVAGAVFWLAYDSGSFTVESRTTTAIVVWWTLAGLVAAGLVRVRLSGEGKVAASILALLAAWTALSLAWAPNNQAAFDEVGRVLLYLGVFLLVAALAPQTVPRSWCDGIVIGSTAIVVLALVSRLFPNVIDTGAQYRFLPFGQTRLNYPIGYWNGLAIFAALALPLLLRVATAARSAVARAGAVAAVPAYGAAMYLTSSRGGAATAAVALLVFVVLTPRRVQTLAATAVGLAGVAVVVHALRARPEIVNDPTAAAATGQGHAVAGITIGSCVAVAAVFALLDRFVLQGRRFPVAWERTALGAVLVAVAIAVLAANPRERFDAFKRLPAASQAAPRDYVRSHLLSSSGNGRWQYWTVAADEFRAHPVNGGGAGSYVDWWQTRRPIASYVVDAHSLYVEVLGELGIVGLALVAALVVLGVVVVVRRLRSARGAGRVTVAALGAVFVAFAFGAGIDWMWELTVVTVVGVIALALLCTRVRGEPSARARPAVRVALAAAAAAVVAVEGIPFLMQTKLDESRAAVRRGDAAAALADARSARKLAPWAYEPYLQLALVEERTGNVPAARKAIARALERYPRNWQLWLVDARLQTKAGAIADARASLRRVRELNPRSGIGGS